MKKSILSLSAAVALGGLGFATGAHAIAYFGAGVTTPTANDMKLNPGSVGHVLYTPYYTAQGKAATLLNITNTDSQNGKAVKVRFRGAANSDDMLDFTVYLSPEDVWTASLSAGANGYGELTTSDTSCTIPFKDKWPAKLNGLRLPGSMSAEDKVINANEGYIEVLNMADIPPYLTGRVDKDGNKVANPLYTNIKHVNGVAPCDSSKFAGVQSTSLKTSASDALDVGLDSPTGGLMGTWAVFNQEKLAVFSGNMGAIVATAGGIGSDGVTPLAAPGYIAFAPQVGAPLGTVPAGFIKTVTADPLLRSGFLTPLWFDLPDMSSPLTAAHSAIAQANLLSTALGRVNVMNDYAANGGVGSTPQETDWIVSQPTRRYHAAVAYDVKNPWNDKLENFIAWNDDMSDPDTDVTNSPDNNIYSGLQLNAKGQACYLFKVGSTDREEGVAEVSIGGDFSPGEYTTYPYCGEVFTLTFNNDTSILNATVTNSRYDAFAEAGWGKVQTGSDVALPMVGFAAISLQNGVTGQHYGWTLPHRWDK